MAMPVVDAGKLIVFVSYARSDMAFVDRIVPALEAKGFACRVDRRHLEYGQRWQVMLGDFIAEADTVVFVVSPRSVASTWCKWEVAQVASLSKRLVPIMLESVAPEDLPAEVAEWHLLSFEPDGDFDRQMAALADVLSADRAWVREHTRLLGLAATWERSRRQADALMLGVELAAAEKWKEQPRKHALQPNVLVEAFISESRAEGARRVRRRARIAWSIAAGALLLVGIAAWQGIAATHNAGVAQEQRQVAEAELKRALIAQSRFLAEKADEAATKGDFGAGALLALEALPDAKSGGKRPFVDGIAPKLHDALPKIAERAILSGHSAPVAHASYSPDGTLVVTASRDGTARIWDVATGRQRTVLRGHTHRVESAVFDPKGKLVITASKDKTARVWEVATGKAIAVLTGHCPAGRDYGVSGCGVSIASFSPDGNRAVTASYDGTSRVWEIATEREISVLRHRDRVVDAAFSPDGNRVVTASWDNTSRVWDATSGRELASYTGSKESAFCATFTPNGARVATAFDDGTVLVWETETGRKIAVLTGHDEQVQSVRFSPDGQRVVTASWDKTARVSNAETGDEIAVLKGHREWVESAAFSADGESVLTASLDGTARLWETVTGKELFVFGGHEGGLNSAEISPDGKQILTASSDNTARLWNLRVGKANITLVGHQHPLDAAAFSPDGSRVITASRDNTARLWDAASGNEIAVLKGHGSAVVSAAFNRDGTHIVTASYDKTARVWDAANGTEKSILEGHTEEVVSATFSPDGLNVVTASKDSTARVWRAMTGKQIAVVRHAEGVVADAKFSPDGKHIVTASYDKTARIWDAATGIEFVALAGHELFLNSVNFSADGRRIVTASYDKTARVWEAATGKQITVLKGHNSDLNSAAFSPDGTRIVTASSDDTARIWEADTGREIFALSHDDTVSQAEFSPDGSRIVTASFDETARLWEVATGRVIAIFGGHADLVTTAAFSQDGHRVVTASFDGVARLWKAPESVQALINDAKARLARCLSAAQRRQFFLDEEEPDWCNEMSKWPYRPLRFGFSYRDLKGDTGPQRPGETSGTVVSRIVEGMPAMAAGLAVDDLILAIDGKPISNSRVLDDALDAVPHDGYVHLTVQRGRQRKEIKLQPRY